MKKGFLQITFIAVFITITSTSIAQKMALKLNKGQKLKVFSTTTTKVTMNAMGQEMESNINSKTATQVVILNNENNTYQIGQTLTSIQSNMQGMGQDISYDSEKKDNSGPMAESMDKIINKEKKITIDNTGKLTKEENSQVQEASNMLGTAVNTDGIAILMKSLLNQNMKVGNTWIDITEDTAGQMKTKNNLTFKVINVKSDTATIDYKGTKTIEGTMEQMGQEMTLTSSNNITGNLKVNIKNGLLLESEINSIGTGSMEVSGMTIPNTSSSKIVTKIVAE